MKKIHSPINDMAVIIEDKISTRKIIDLYNSNRGVDVSDYFKDLTEVLICKCKETGYRFYWPQRIIGDELFYEKLSSIEDYTRSWSFDHQFAFEKVADNDTVLDIGCGNGDFLQRLKKGKTVNLKGLELNSFMVKKCKEKGLDVSNESITVHRVLNKNKYDVICALQVLEHVYNIKDFLKDILYLLKPGGKIIFSTPNNEPYYMNYGKYETLNLPPHHMGLWNKESYKGLAGYFGLQIKEFSYCPPPSFKGNVYYKANQLMGYKASFKNPLFYFALVYATLYCGLHQLTRGYNGTYIAAEFIKPLKPVYEK